MEQPAPCVRHYHSERGYAPEDGRGGSAATAIALTVAWPCHLVRSPWCCRPALASPAASAVGDAFKDGGCAVAVGYARRYGNRPGYFFAQMRKDWVWITPVSTSPRPLVLVCSLSGTSVLRRTTKHLVRWRGYHADDVLYLRASPSLRAEMTAEISTRHARE